jgi:hypothetical protein
MFTRNRLIIPAPLREPLQMLARDEGMTLNQYILKVLDEHVSVKEAEGRLRGEVKPSSGTQPAQVSSDSDRTRFQPWGRC